MMVHRRICSAAQHDSHLRLSVSGVTYNDWFVDKLKMPCLTTCMLVGGGGGGGGGGTSR